MPLTTSLVEAWNLQEASGNRAGAFASLTLTDNNTVTQTTGPSSVIPQAALFTAANSEYLSRADEAALSLTGDCTIVGWVKLTSKPANLMFVCAKHTGTNDGQLEIYWDNVADRLSAAIVVGGAVTAIAASTFGAPSTGTWLFVCATYTASDKKVRISVNNGAFDVSAAAAANPADTTAAFLVGAFTGPTLFWDGAVGALDLWGTVLSAGQIGLLYNGGRGQLYPFFNPKLVTAGLVNDRRMVNGGLVRA